jgi:N-glycosylase/DNA lyase
MHEDLLKLYSEKKDELKRRLRDFKQVFNESDEKVFTELAFCLCTPQSKATSCWNAVSAIAKNNLLFSGSGEQIKPFLNSVRFSENKTKYIVEARNLFTTDSQIQLKDKLQNFENSQQAREWLVENVNGFGMKEASHFLRNIGFDDFAIIDFHIVDILVKHDLIKRPKTLTKTKYLEIENLLRTIGKKTDLTLAELDLYLWYMETGKILK